MARDRLVEGIAWLEEMVVVIIIPSVWMTGCVGVGIGDDDVSVVVAYGVGSW